MKFVVTTPLQMHRTALSDVHHRSGTETDYFSNTLVSLHHHRCFIVVVWIELLNPPLLPVCIGHNSKKKGNRLATLILMSTTSKNLGDAGSTGLITGSKSNVNSKLTLQSVKSPEPVNDKRGERHVVERDP